MLKIAYCGTPHTGGTYTVYKQLRDGLAKHDIELRWIGLAKQGTKLEYGFKQEENFGEFLYYQESKEEVVAQFIRHIESNYSGIIFNVLACRYQTNSARYISDKILKLQIVHTITPATYRAARAIKDHVHATVGVSPRIAKNLIDRLSFFPNRVHIIPNSVNIEKFTNYHSVYNQNQTLKLLSLGRIEESSKGVLWLPQILNACLKKGHNLTMTVAGEGGDLPKLKLRFEKLGLSNYVEFLGKVKYYLVPEIFSQHQVFLMPSRFEGFGSTIVEGMATGCVPVCSQIHGVTDFIISHGDNGFLFPVGDVDQAASLIGQLTNVSLWGKMSENARTVSQGRFSLESQASSYANLIYSLRGNPPQIAKTISINDWALPAGLKPSFSVYLPDSVKNIIRVWRERHTALLN